MMSHTEAKKGKVVAAMGSVFSRFSLHERPPVDPAEIQNMKRSKTRAAKTTDTTPSVAMPGVYVGQATTSGNDPLTRHYSMVKDPGGGLTFWVYCPEKDTRAHEDESMAQVEDVLEFCENRGLDCHAVYAQLKHLDPGWARQFKKRRAQARVV